MASQGSQGAAEPPVASPNFLIHGNLADASCQIRLLKLKPGVSDDRIDCELSVHDRQDAPVYAAISYTWVEPIESHSITVNGHTISVREKCQYSLWQARSFGQYEFFWMDALCINQSNVAEKNRQVAMMGDIFAQAEAVLACVGPHADDSELALSTLRDRSEPPWFRSSLQGLLDDWQEDWERNLQVSDSICAFSSRVYWHRVWIVQELMVARVIYILCGSDALEWPRHAELDHEGSQWPFVLELRQGKPLRRKENVTISYDYGPMWDIIATVPSRRLSFEKMVDTFYDWECTHLLDRVYGFLSIIEWTDESSSSINQLQPDYSKSAFELMIECIDHLACRSNDVASNTACRPLADWKAIESLMMCLRLDGSDENIANWILQRQKIRGVDDSSYRQRSIGESYPIFSNGTRWQACYRLKRMNDECFAVVPGVEKDRRADSDPDELIPQVGRLSTATGGAKSVDDHAEDGIVGLLCPMVQDGDIVLEWNYALKNSVAGYRPGFVLREVRDFNSVLEIVGYAAISTCCRFETGQEICDLDEEYMTPQAYEGDLEARFHSEDVIAFTALWDPERAQSIEEILQASFTGSRFSSVFVIKPFKSGASEDLQT